MAILDKVLNARKEDWFSHTLNNNTLHINYSFNGSQKIQGKKVNGFYLIDALILKGCTVYCATDTTVQS